MTDSATSVPASGEDQQPAAVEPAATGEGTPPRSRELESRIAGLDAKVSHLQAERDALQKKADDLASGQINAESSYKAAIDAKDKEIATLQRQFEAASLRAQYPKSAEKLGDSITSVPAENLADLEASLTSATAEPAAAPAATPPRPVPSNAPDADGNRELSRDDLVRRAAAEVRSQFN